MWNGGGEGDGSCRQSGGEGHAEWWQCRVVSGGSGKLYLPPASPPSPQCPDSWPEIPVNNCSGYLNAG